MNTKLSQVGYYSKYVNLVINVLSAMSATKTRQLVFSAAGQRLRVVRTYAGRTGAITVEDTVFRVFHNNVELVTHA